MREHVARRDRERRLGDDTLRGGTRCVSALTVATRMRGRSLGAARQREPRERGHALRGDRGVGRDAVVGLAVPGRQHERLDLRRGEGERVDEILRADRIAGEEGQRDGAVLRLARERAREIGDDEGVEPLGRAGERDRRSAGGAASRRRRGRSRGFAPPARGAAAQFGEQRRVEARRASAPRRSARRESPDRAGRASASTSSSSASLERGEMRVGEGAEREVHLAQAAAAGAKQNATPSRVEPGAGEGHVVLKGEVHGGWQGDIVCDAGNVSAFSEGRGCA